MNGGDISQRIIESITTSKANISRLASADVIGNREGTNKRKRVQFDSIPMDIGPLSEDMMEPRNTFISKDLYLSMTPEDLSERWYIIVAQAALTLKATTRKLVRWAIIPLARG